MSKRNLSNKQWFCISVLCIMILICVSIIGYLGYRKFHVVKKEIPYVEDMGDFRQYSEEELEEIFFKSDYVEIGRFIQSLSEAEQKELKKACSYITDNSKVTVSYPSQKETDSNKSQSYKTTIYDYALKSYKKYGTDLKEDATEIEVTSENKKLYASGTENGVTNHSYDYYLDLADDYASFDAYEEKLDSQLHFLSGKQTNFYISFLPLGDRYMEWTGVDWIKTGTKQYDYSELAGNEDFQKELRKVSRKGKNKYKATVSLYHEKDKDTKFIHCYKSGIEKYGNIVIKNLALTDMADKNLYNADYTTTASGLRWSTNTKKSSSPKNPNSDGDNIKADSQSIFVFNMEYGVPYNLIPTSSQDYDTSATGRFSFHAWTSGKSGFYEDDNGYDYFEFGVNTLGFKNTKKMNHFDDMEHQMNAKMTKTEVKYTETVDFVKQTISEPAYEWTKTDGTTPILDTLCVQVNLISNSSASEYRRATYAYWEAHKGDNKNNYKKKIKEAYDDIVDDTYNAIQTWLMGCWTDDKDVDITDAYDYKNAMKAIILAPAYDTLKFNTAGGMMIDSSEEYYKKSNNELSDFSLNDELAVDATGKQTDLSKAFGETVAMDSVDVRSNIVKRGYTLKNLWLRAIDTNVNSAGSLRYTNSTKKITTDSDSSEVYKASSGEDTGSEWKYLLYSSYSPKTSYMKNVYDKLVAKGMSESDAAKEAYTLTKYQYIHASQYEKPGSDYADKSKTQISVTWDNIGPEIKYDENKLEKNDTTKDNAVYLSGTTDNWNLENMKAPYELTINATNRTGANTVKTLYSYLKDILYVKDAEDEANDLSEDGLGLNNEIPAVNSYSSGTFKEVDDFGNLPDYKNISPSKCTIDIDGKSTTVNVGPDRIFINKAGSDYESIIPTVKENEVKTFTFELTVYDYAGEYHYITVKMKIKGGGPTSTPTSTPTVTTPPPSQTTVSGNYHTGHKFTESELKALVGTGAEKYAYKKTDTYTIPSSYLNKRLSAGTTFTVKRTTTWTHTHVSSCRCSGSDRYVPPSGWVSPTYDENGNQTGGGYYMYSGYWTGCGNTYCNCTYASTLSTEIKTFEVTIGNCAPDMSVRETVPTKTENGKTVLAADLTEKDTLNWNHIVKLVTKDPCDHEDTKQHSGSGTSCSTCSSKTTSVYNKSTWQNISYAGNSGSQYTFTFAGTTGASGKNATLVVDIGKLTIGKHNPGGTYDVKFTLTDADGVVCYKTAKLYIEWSAPLITVNKEISANGLIYHTSDKIPQLDFYSGKVITKAYDYMDVDAVEGNKPLGLAAGTHISSDLTTLKDSDGYPKYIKILDTKTLYVKMKGSDEVCNIKDTNQQTPAENWRAANSVVSEKIFEISIRCYNPRNSDYYTDVEGIKVKVVNDAPTVGMGDHLLVLYEEWTEDLIVDFPSTMAWDYEDGTITNKDANNITYGTETFTSKDGTQRIRKGIEKTASCLIPNGTYLPNGDSPENTSDGKANYNVRSKGDSYRLRFKIVDWGGKDVFMAANGYTYFNTNYEGRFKCTMRFYDLDGAYTDRDFWVEVRKTEAQKQPHLRFINKYFFYQDEAFGGLASDSIWRTNPEYYNELKNSLETDVTNSDESNNWAGCQRVYIYTADDIKEAKSIIKKHTVDKGAGNGTMDFNDEFIAFMNKHRVK